VRAHSGKIQGAAQALTEPASATGPLLLAECVTQASPYAAMFYAPAAVVAALGLSAWFVNRAPAHEPVGVTDRRQEGRREPRARKQ
jgi:uncharacterized protein YfaQ (DUF2300 family)